MNKRMIFLLFGMLSFIGGIFLIMNSVPLGMDLVNGIITQAGHSFTDREIEIYLSSNIENVRTVGIAFLFVGGIIVCLFGTETRTKK